MAQLKLDHGGLVYSLRSGRDKRDQSALKQGDSYPLYITYSLEGY